MKDHLFVSTSAVQHKLDKWHAHFECGGKKTGNAPGGSRDGFGKYSKQLKNQGTSSNSLSQFCSSNWGAPE